jgi:XXXCH domain-containing protein
MSGEKRYFEDLSQAELAEFFRGLSDRLSGIGPDAADAAETGGAQAPDPGDFKKLKLSIKRELGGYSLKWKSKALYKPAEGAGPAAAGPAAEEGEVKYKKLKKRMKESFKMITESLMTDVMPGEAVVTAFLQDSKLMTSFPEKGAEFYDDYDRACAEFAIAFDAKDLTACKAAAITLNQLKKDCHSRYK